jgi:hypothetical protein
MAVAQPVWDVCSQSSRKTTSKKYRYNDRCSDVICGLRFCDGVQVIKVVGRRIGSSAHIHTRYVIRSLRDISKTVQAPLASLHPCPTPSLQSKTQKEVLPRRRNIMVSSQVKNQSKKRRLRSKARKNMPNPKNAISYNEISPVSSPQCILTSLHHCSIAP